MFRVITLNREFSVLYCSDRISTSAFKPVDATFILYSMSVPTLDLHRPRQHGVQTTCLCGLALMSVVKDFKTVRLPSHTADPAGPLALC